MARQSTTPVQFQRTKRKDRGSVMSSGDPGKVVPCGFIPVLRGDSVAGRFAIDIDLAEMPRPLLNGVIANVQAWFVPKTAHPQFAGYDEFMAAYNGENIKALGQSDRTPPEFFLGHSAPVANVTNNDEILKTLGIHPVENIAGNYAYNTDLHDAFTLIYNFRLAAHSSKLALRSYFSEDAPTARALPKAFWPSGPMARVVADYERALVVGNLDLDVVAGQVPVSGLGTTSVAVHETGVSVRDEDGSNQTWDGYRSQTVPDSSSGLFFKGATGGDLDIFAEMAGQTIGTSLADIDKARETQAFAKLRASMAGNDTTGFNNDDAILADLMQGFDVPQDMFNRPWLLDSARVPFGMVERDATDGANLDKSVTTGRAGAQLSLNVPKQDVGGMIVITVEVMPERLRERTSEEFLSIDDPSDLPNALRDVQRVEPVDMVVNRRVDARHTNPDGLYGYEPMNDVWNREYTRLGGSFYQDDPANPWTEQRSAIWQANVVDPDFTADHYLCPDPFPKYVFSDALAPAFEFVARHAVTISGLTQIGDVVHENTDDYTAISG